jgi:hypothetical protein
VSFLPVLTRFWRQRSRRGKASIIVAGLLLVALAGQAPREPGLANSTAPPNATLGTLATSPIESAAPSPVASKSGTPEPTVGSIPVIAPTPTPAPVRLLDLKGRGIKNSKTFTTTAQWTLHYTFDCKSFGYKGNFQVYLFRGTDLVAILVNDLARKGGSSTPAYETGTFHLEMNSECSWHVKVTQP